VVGGIWYLRNLLQHGSPLWPFAIGPWGDPAPRFLGLVDATFAQDPLGTLDGRLGSYIDRLGGSWLLLAGGTVALVLGALAPGRVQPVRRPLLVAGVLTLVGCLIWTTAWGTGVSTSPLLSWPDGFAFSSLRYLLPAIGAGGVAVALVARAGGLLARGAAGLLITAVVWNLVKDAQLGSPWTPPLWVLVVGAIAGISVLALGAAAVARRTPRVPAIAAAGVAVVAGALLAPVSSGFVERSTTVPDSTAYARELVAWILKQPGYAGGDGSIGFASRGVLAQFAGDRFDHPLVLVPQHASCAEIEDMARRMPVVITHPLFLRGTLGVESYTGFRCLRRHHRPLLGLDPYYVYRLPDRTGR
jgi:hypothetical protein